MSKKITITEQDVDEPYEEIIEQVDNSPPEPPPPDPPPPPPQPEKQKADCKMRMRELYKCDDCGKYLTKKSLNYSHYKTCRGKPENQIKPEPKPQAPPPKPQAPAPAGRVGAVLRGHERPRAGLGGRRLRPRIHPWQHRCLSIVFHIASYLNHTCEITAPRE